MSKYFDFVPFLQYHRKLVSIGLDVIIRQKITDNVEGLPLGCHFAALYLSRLKQELWIFLLVAFQKREPIQHR